MPEPYVQHYHLMARDGQIKLASVILDQADFDVLIDELVATGMLQDGEQVKTAGFIPLIQRGTKTAFIFARFGVTCDKLGIMVRGKGMELLRKMIPNPEAN